MSDPLPPRLAHNFRWILIGNAALAASQWGIVVILARFTPPEILGAYALALSIGAPVFGLTNLDLRTLQVTEHPQQTSFATYYRLRLSTGLASVVALGALALFLPYSIAAGLAIAAIALSKFFDGLSDVIYGRLQVREIVAPIGKSQLTKAVLSLTVLGLTLAIVSNPMWTIGATVVPSLAVLFFYDLPNLRRHGGTSLPGLRMACGATVRKMASLARCGLPLTVVGTLVILHAAIPRLVVASQIGERGVGVLAALSYLALAPNLLVVALGQASMTSLAGNLAKGNRRGYLTGVSRILGAAVAIGVTIFLVGFWSGGTILSMFYGPRFLGYERELVVFLGAGAVSYLNTAVGYSLSSARVFGLQIPMMAVVCVVSLVVSLLFVARWGVAGAAASQLMSMLVQLVWSSLLLWRTVATRFHLPSAARRAMVVTGIAVHSQR